MIKPKKFKMMEDGEKRARDIVSGHGKKGVSKDKKMLKLREIKMG